MRTEPERNGWSPESLPATEDVVGTPISTTSYRQMLDLLGGPKPSDRALVVAVCNVHSVMSARRDPVLAEALRRADVATPDGMPLVWAMRRLGVAGQQRVYGPDLMEMALPYGLERGWTHYFYGATPETLAALRDAAERLAPGAQVLGMHAPPFRPLTEVEQRLDVERIRDSGAEIVWVGLGMPKQEKWMRQVAPELPGVALVGVGAAFDLLSGRVPQAPDWLQDRGLEWAYRLYREPRRLWRRYLWNNPAYLVALARQLAGAGRSRAHV